MNKLDLEYLNNNNILIGMDEAGRGPLCGPVFSAAVYVDSVDDLKIVSKVGADSKKISEKERKKRYNFLIKNVKYKCNKSSAEEVDEINIFKATELSMKRNINDFDLNNKEYFCIIDGKGFKFNFPFECIIKGDDKSSIIGAASIIAKVTRDEYMINLSKKYQCYNLEKNKGYPTKEHVLKILENGIFSEHRITFNPIKKFLINKEIAFNSQEFSSYRKLRAGIL